MIKQPPATNGPDNTTTGWFRSPATWSSLSRYLSEYTRCDMWSGACSTGEEPYSAALLLDGIGIDGTIHASDINEEALAIAEAGLYDVDHVNAYMATRSLGVQKLVAQGLQRRGDHYRVRDRIRRRVRFTHADLRTATPPTVDVAFVANAWRFFQPNEQDRLLQAIRRALPTDGRLIIGPADLYSPHLSDHRPPNLTRYFYETDYPLILKPHPEESRP